MCGVVFEAGSPFLYRNTSHSKELSTLQEQANFKSDHRTNDLCLSEDSAFGS